MTTERSPRELHRYRVKRDFRRTPEPAPGQKLPGTAGQLLSGSNSAGMPSARFVVHEHHARRLHWDLRLERDGALMSWAVPNGIPQDPRENRKAIHVEDHPLSYLDFEGEIPAGNYGAGRVLIWDRGSYECEKLEDGKLIVVFHGERLQGRYALFRTSDEKDWMIHRMDPPPHSRETMPAHLPPMLARPGRLLDDDDGWAFEVKWDGVRAITYWRPGRLRIESRNLNDVSSRYPELRPLGRQLGAREAVLDGEIVAFDEHGAPSFERLQRRMHLTSESAIRRLAREAPVTYVIFDVLYLDGACTMELPYYERRALLEQLALNGPAWQVPVFHLGDGADFLAVTAEHGLEGMIAKRMDSRYRPGERRGEWLKIKNVNRQELVIGGWLPGNGKRAGQVGALLMGYHEGEGEGEQRALRYAGRVGTGFQDTVLQSLATELSSRRRRSSPFSKRGIQPPRNARFVEPELVAEIEFSHWTRERILRHSSYKGLRSDKPAEEVEVETETETTQVSPAAPRAPRRKPRLQEARRTPRRGSSETEGGGQPHPYEVLHETKRHAEIQVQGRTLRLSNREKVLYPRAGFTKGQMIDYYAALAPVLLPHLVGRPLTLKRYPDGVEGPYFYEKRCPAYRPDWVHTAAVWSERQQEQIDYCLVEDLPTLIWTANLANIELHTSLSPARDLSTPTALVFDLDPGAPAGLRECCRVALLIEELFEAFGLRTTVKSSGSKGLQVYLPLNTPVSYEQTKLFARAVAELLEREHPRLVVSRMGRSLRPGRVLIDWSQNDPHKTTVCVYSLRARERPTVSTPLTWEEVRRGSRSRREPQLSVEPPELLERVERHGDLFAGLPSLTQALPDLGGGTVDFYERAREGSSRGGGAPTKSGGGREIPPRGVKKGSKRERRYELRSGKPGPRGRTREQLYQEARKLGVEGRSSMNKAQLRRAVENKKRS
jgi:bifunctional non-homologous end joining protein LigD